MNGPWQRPDVLREQADLGELQGLHNAAFGLLARSGGFHLEKVVVLDASGGSDAKDVFVFEKTVRVLAMHLEVIDATVMTNLTGVYVDAWDGSASEQITLDGAVLSGFEVGTFLLKDQDAASPLTVARADQVRMVEPATGKKSHQPFTLTAKTGTENHVRLRYTTTDTPINAALKVVIEYACINGGIMGVT